MRIIVDRTYNVRQELEVPDGTSLEKAREFAEDHTRSAELTDGGEDLELIDTQFYREPTQEEVSKPDEVQWAPFDLGPDKPLVAWFDIDW